MQESEARGHKIKILDIGGGFPAPYHRDVRIRSRSWPGKSTPRSTASFPRTSRSLPSRAGSWLLPPPPPLPTSSARPVRDGKTCYYIDDSVYHTFSGIIFDHCQYHLKAFKQGNDRNLRRVRPDLRRAGHAFRSPKSCRNSKSNDLVYSDDIGAYSNASATWFNGFPPARVVHVNE